MAVQPENVRTWEAGGREFDLEASLGTGIVYRDEFLGKLDAPYKGILADDMLMVYRGAQPTVTGRFATDDDGNFVLGDDGDYVTDMAAPEVTLSNPLYVGHDVGALLRIAWAMARSVNPEWGEPYRKGYKAFRDEVMHLSAGAYEEARLYELVVLELGGGIIFRRPARPASSGSPDAEDTAER